jgi:hypothetical protein
MASCKNVFTSGATENNYFMMQLIVLQSRVLKRLSVLKKEEITEWK